MPAGTTWLQRRVASGLGRAKTDDAIKVAKVLVAASVTHRPLLVPEVQPRLGAMQVVHLGQ